MAKSDPIEAALEAHAKAAMRLEVNEAARYLRLLRDFRERLVGRIASGSARAWDALRLRQTFLEIEAEIAALEKRFGVAYQSTIKASEDLAFGHVLGEVKEMSAAWGGSVPASTGVSARILADETRGILADQFATSVARYGSDVLRGVQRELFMGMRAGDTTTEIVKRLNSPTGILADKAKSDVVRLVRTETSEAYGSAQLSAAEAVGEQIPDARKTWWHSSNYPCKVCIPLHRTTRPMDGTWTFRLGKQERTVAQSPAHPNCTCRILVTRPGWEEKLKRLGYGKTEGEEIPEAA